MFLHFVGALWKAIAPGMADHLWQSTLFATAAALLTLALRRNSARLRYAIWLVTSLKFLVPFSLLVAAGSVFSWRHSPVATGSGMNMVEIVGQPFTNPLVVGTAGIPTPAGSVASTQLLPLLLCVWLIGFLGVLCVWIARWLRVAQALCNSTVLTSGREFSILRRLEELHRAQRAQRSTMLMQSENSLEPGVFGIFRPVLLWPRSVSEHLDDAHLEAVLAHELCHVRRRDNLAAVLHMLVEAVFWFHPLVWWIGAQLIAERERACDEAVIELGSHRHTYAESILKVCEFCLSSPLTCVSGVTGADLKKRMVQIMTDRVVRKLNFTRKLLLGTAACLALALPVVFGLLKVTPAHASGNPLDQFAGSWESKYQGRAFFTLNMVVKDGLLTGTAVHSTRITSQNGELVPDSDDSATDKVLEAHVADKKLLLKIEDPGDPSAPMPLELRLTAENEAEGRLVTDGQSGVPQQTKPWRFVRVSDVESQGSSTPHFSSVSIKSHPAENQGFMTQKMMIAPVKNGGEISVRGVSLHSMIRTAYRVQESQIVAEPDWVKTERYDIDAKLDPSIAEQARKLSDAEDRLMAQQMMQQFLAEYFKVSVHQEVQDQPVYELVVTDGGSKLQPVQDPNKKAMMRMGLGELNSEGTPLDLLVAQLSQRLGRTVVDKTGLKGNYIFNLHWTPDADEQARIRAAAPGLPEPGVEKPSASGPPLMTAVEEQLGLKLQPTTERVPVLIIDHAEQPAQN